MREAMFIKKNAEKWKEYQQLETDNPDETAERFITLIDDLAYAKTFYPRSKVTRWINGIAASIYQSIYRNRKEKYSRIFLFWKYELPLLFRRYHLIFLCTVLMFLLATGIGIYSSMHNEDFVRYILGDNYVDMTERNIANGDPFGVYKSDNAFNMFITIAFNNIRVAFQAFAGGFTAGLWTIYILWFNGVMLGSFQYIFFAKDLGLESVLVIWIHGMLEIPSIVIAATSGFILAYGFLFPGTYSRLASFRRCARDAAKILITLVPLFIIAAFFESYVTHLMSQTYETGARGGLPVWLSLVILTVSFLFIIWYFIIWPIILHRRGFYIQDNGIVERAKTKK